MSLGAFDPQRLRLPRALFPFVSDTQLPEEEIRARLLMAIAASIGVPALIVFAIQALLAGHVAIAVLELVCALLCVTIYLVTRQRLMRLLPRLTLLIAVSIMVIACMRQLVGFSLVWPLIVPIIATFGFGQREGLLWSSAGLLFWMSLLTQPHWFGIQVTSAPGVWPSSGQIADFFFGYLLVSFLTFGYEALRMNAMELVSQRQRGLEDSEARLQGFADTASDWLFELDAQARLSFLSSRWIDLTGIDPDEVLGLDLLAFANAENTDDVALWREQVRQRRPFRDVLHRITRPDGTIVSVSVRGNPVFDPAGRFLGYRGTGTNVTERERIAAEMREKDHALLQASKMEAVGQLTSGVAHDFNNLLTVIVGNLELLELRLGEAGAAGEELDQAMAASQRAADLTSKLLTFSRRQSLLPEVIDVGPLLDDMLQMLRRTLEETIELSVWIAPDTPPCEVDRSQLQNALLNLAINGRDAMAEGGRLTLAASPCTIDETAGRLLEVPAGVYVSISVTDTGVGMAADLLEHVFEPFFSTKPQGRGTGLGLSMVYGFLRQSGGGVRITSEPGRGTCVELLLPRGQESGRSAKAPAAQFAASGEGRRVLVVEDEDAVRELVVSMLHRLGYVCDAVGTAADALVQFDRRSYDLVLTDVVLAGGMSGPELVDGLRERKPEVRTLFMSGYSEEAFRTREPQERAVDLLPKPFGLRELARHLEQVFAA